MGASPALLTVRIKYLSIPMLTLLRLQDEAHASIQQRLLSEDLEELAGVAFYDWRVAAHRVGMLTADLYC